MFQTATLTGGSGYFLFSTSHRPSNPHAAPRNLPAQEKLATSLSSLLPSHSVVRHSGSGGLHRRGTRFRESGYRFASRSTQLQLTFSLHSLLPLNLVSNFLVTDWSGSSPTWTLEEFARLWRVRLQVCRPFDTAPTRVFFDLFDPFDRWPPFATLVRGHAVFAFPLSSLHPLHERSDSRTGVTGHKVRAFFAPW